MRVCLATEAYYPIYAGGALRFARYAPGLRARGIRLEVLTAAPRLFKAAMSGVPTADGRDGLSPFEVIDSVPVHRVRLPAKGHLGRQFHLGRQLLRFCRRPDGPPDVVQLLSAPATLLPALAGLRRSRIPVVVNITMFPNPSPSTLERVLRRALPAPLNRADHVVVSSTLMGDQLRATGTTAPITVIPNGVDLDRFRPPADALERRRLRNALGLGDDELVLVYAGGVSPRKGMDLLLAAWARLAPSRPELRLVIVGPRKDLSDPGLGPFRDRLASLLAASGAADRVRFAGLVENVEDYLRAADIFVFTSRREGMPNALLEAMASGLPVVTTRFVTVPTELGEPEKHYLLAELDAESLAGQLERLAEAPGLRAGLGRAAHEWVTATMALDRSLDLCAALYQELADRRRGRR
ncbi:MAG: glycosyltransferase family 4 protein [Gemmatimonadetes bacterium]|nr:glycosyltransferase family 4 protein [Gemmatimonadota bacterium]